MTRGASQHPAGTRGAKAPRSTTALVLTAMFRNRLAIFGAIVVAVVICVALLAPMIMPFDPDRPSLANRLAPPSSENWFGTDHYGRDVLSRTIWGARTSLLVAVTSVLVGTSVGLLLGLVAGFFGGGLDSVIMRTMDVLLAFPLLLLALALISVFGSSLANVILATGIATIPRFARVVRGSVLSVKERDYIQATRALGSGSGRMMFLHVLPNALAPLIVMATLYSATVIILEANLGFLGFGVQPPEASWGSIVNDGRRYLREGPWVSIFPSVAIVVTVVGINLFGDGLRDAMDPHVRNR